MLPCSSVEMDRPAGKSSDRMIDVHVRRLLRKLKIDQLIRTEQNGGYMCLPQVERGAYRKLASLCSPRCTTSNRCSRDNYHRGGLIVIVIVAVVVVR